LPDGALQGVKLERDVELGGVRLRVLDWPGHGRPLVYVPDPFTLQPDLAPRIAAAFAPKHRVVRIQPRSDLPYQAQMDDIRRAMQQFGFADTVLLSSGGGACIVLPLASWYPRLVNSVLLIDPCYEPPAHDSLTARSLRDCPPDWERLQGRCRMLTTKSEELVPKLEELL